VTLFALNLNDIHPERKGITTLQIDLLLLDHFPVMLTIDLTLS